MKKLHQLDLFPKEPPKRDRLFKRQGSKFWQARFWVSGAWQQRSTFTTNRLAAGAVIECWKKQFERRGKPAVQKKVVFADLIP